MSGTLFATTVWKSRAQRLRPSKTEGSNRPNSTPVFFGFCNVFRHFLPNLCRFTAPIHRKLRKDQLVHFQTLTEIKRNKVEQLKSLPTSRPLPASPRADGHLTIDNDVFDTQMECVLLQ